jgi:hypothetical protein
VNSSSASPLWPISDRYGQAQQILAAVFTAHAGASVQSVRDELALRMLSVGIDWPPGVYDEFAQMISHGFPVQLGAVDGHRTIRAIDLRSA